MVHSASTLSQAASCNMLLHGGHILNIYELNITCAEHCLVQMLCQSCKCLPFLPPCLVLCHQKIICPCSLLPAELRCRCIAQSIWKCPSVCRHWQSCGSKIRMPSLACCHSTLQSCFLLYIHQLLGMLANSGRCSFKGPKACMCQSKTRCAAVCGGAVSIFCVSTYRCGQVSQICDLIGVWLDVTPQIIATAPVAGWLLETVRRTALIHPRDRQQLRLCKMCTMWCGVQPPQQRRQSPAGLFTTEIYVSVRRAMTYFALSY